MLYLDVCVLAAFFNEANCNANRIAENFAAFVGHAIGHRQGRHTPRLSDSNYTLGMPSELVQILEKIYHENHSIVTACMWFCLRVLGKFL